MSEILPGDIFLTRNLKEEDNSSPGYWNHAAIFVGDEKVIEGQVAPYNMVIVADFQEFWIRYPQILVLRMATSPALERKMIEQAEALVGSVYRKIASWFLIMRNKRKGENCVTVVRKCWQAAFSVDPGWRIPDDIVHYGREIYHKDETETWEPPPTDFWGDSH